MAALRCGTVAVSFLPQALRRSLILDRYSPGRRIPATVLPLP